MNKVTLIGNIGNDIEVRNTTSGTAVTNLRIATSFGSGENQKTEWHDIVLFGKTAELAGEYLKKGSKAMFEGRVQTRKYQDKDGNDRYSTEVVGQEMTFLPNGGGAVNRIALLGNLGADPETASTQGGKAVANFRLATTENRKNQDGTKEELTEWHRVVAFGKTAEIAGEYLKKGSKVYLEGRLQHRSYEKEGSNHYTTEVVIDSMTMLGGGQSDEAQG